LLGDQLEIDDVAEQRLQGAVIGAAINRAQHLVGKVLQPRHELDPEQGAQPEEVLGEAVGVRGMLADRQDGVVFEDAGEHVTRFARRAGDHPRGVDAVLVDLRPTRSMMRAVRRAGLLLVSLKLP
jgi:hypothetical protein